MLPAELLDTDDPAELRELFDAALCAVAVVPGRGPLAGRGPIMDATGQLVKRPALPVRVWLVPHRDDGLAGVAAAQDAPSRNVQPV